VVKDGSDTGVGSENTILYTDYSLEDSDSGSGADASTLLNEIVSSDVGEGVDSIDDFLRTLEETGSGEDESGAVGQEGRPITLVTYTGLATV